MVNLKYSKDWCKRACAKVQEIVATYLQDTPSGYPINTLLAGFFQTHSYLPLFANADIISRVAERVSDLIGGFSDPLYLIFLRVAVIYLIVGVLCAFSHYRTDPNNLETIESKYRQVGLAVVGLLIGVFVPLDKSIPHWPMLKAWVFLVSVLIAVIGPKIVPYYVLPSEEAQRPLMLWCYYVSGACIAHTILF